VHTGHDEAFNPFEIRDDPYPTYARLREDDPVHHSDVIDAWVLSRYSDVEHALKDPRFSSRRSEDSAGGSMVFDDPPDHTRLRNLVNKPFAKAVEQMTPRIETLCEQLLSDALSRDEIDLVADFAYPFPLRVIGELLGVGSSDRDRFKRWADEIAASLDHVGSTAPRVGGDETESLAGYLAAVVEERRAHPRDDFVSYLAAEPLTDGEVLGLSILLLFAGHETTVNLIGNGVLSLMRHPDQLERLRADPTLLRTAIDEFLRFEPPVHIARRRLLEDVQIHGRTMPAGDPVVLLLGSANRDPFRFDDPDTLDVGRKPNPHVTFGHGIHFCLGAPLARIEGRVAFSALLERLPDLRLATDEVRWRETVVLRGLESLQLVR